MSSKLTILQVFRQRFIKGSAHDERAKPSYQSGSAPFKTAIKKRLLMRLVVASTLISITLASIVFYLEFRRLGHLVNNRAGEIAARFNDEIRDLLDSPAVTKTEVLRNKLEMLSIIGKLNRGIGYVIYAGIYDLDGNAIVIDKDPQCSYLDKVDDVMTSLGHQLPESSGKVYKYRYINGIPHIQLTYSLTNNDKKQAAVIEGLFAVSNTARNEVAMRILRSVFGTISVVLLTTMILYPIIMTLVGRLSKLADNLLEANIETLRVLGSAIAKRDSDTDIHNYRVTIYSVTLAEAIGLRYRLIRALIKGAFLHDVGKIGISDKILLKPGKLTVNEFKIMEHHVKHGIDIVEGSVWLKDARDVVGYHHEKFSGEGYPNGLKGDSIPVIARIFAIADVFDALTSVRPYKDQMSPEDAMVILEKGRGTHFDPSILDTFTPIAKSLYERIANSSDETLRENLENITRKYFSRKLYDNGET